MGVEATFLFADLTGFTALTEREGDEAAADLALAFCDRVCELNRGHYAEDVKTLGDASMIIAPDPADGIRLALAIVDEVGPEHGFPEVRVGLHHGPAVERRGDWFGATVNIAARVGALAEPTEVLLTDAARLAAGSPSGIEFVDRGEHRLKGVSSPVSLWSARTPSAP
jgi:adenylate cyclase